MSDNKRRQFLKLSGKMGAGSIATLTFPNILRAANKKPTIRILGTHVTLQEKIRLKAEKDLGINIEFYPGGSAEVSGFTTLYHEFLKVQPETYRGIL